MGIPIDSADELLESLVDTGLLRRANVAGRYNVSTLVNVFAADVQRDATHPALPMADRMGRRTVLESPRWVVGRTGEGSATNLDCSNPVMLPVNVDGTTKCGDMMLILSMKDGHDGGIAAIEDGKLLFALEAEKDNYPRYDRLTGEVMVRAAGMLDNQPDVVALGGWVKGEHSVEPPSRTGYFGVGDEAISDEPGRFFGKQVRYFSSTHERSHIYTSLGMAPAATGQAYYSLVWEGNIGDFYRINERGEVTHLQHVMTDPGAKYAYLFALADPKFPAGKGLFRFNDAGKQMALAGFAEDGPITKEEQETIDFILKQDGIILGLSKDEMSWSHIYNSRIGSQAYRNAAAKHSQAIFNRFYEYAEKNLKEGLPLLISGGCGLNSTVTGTGGGARAVCSPRSSCRPAPTTAAQRWARASTRSGSIPARPLSSGTSTLASSSSRMSSRTQPSTRSGRWWPATSPDTSSKATSLGGPEAATRWDRARWATALSWLPRSP
jgi:hypothetical protein